MGQRSNIEKLPEELRKRLISLLQDPNVTQQAVTDIINEEAGGTVVSLSAVNRYSQKMAKWSEKNRQLREVAETFAATQGVDAKNVVGRVIVEKIKMLAMDLTDDIEELRNNPDPDKQVDVKTMSALLSNLSKGMRELEQAEKLNSERAREIRKEALTEAAQSVEQAAKSNGLTSETVEKIKRQILGL